MIEIESLPAPPTPCQRLWVRPWLEQGLEPDVHDPNYFGVQELLAEEMDLQRRQVKQIGQCNIGCCPENLFPTTDGLICRWTLQPCPNEQLTLIVALVSTVNKRT